MVLASFTAHAQTAGGPPREQQLLQSFQAESATRMSPVLQKYREELLRLERRCAEQRDYAGAAQARDERLQAEKTFVARTQLTSGTNALPSYADGPITLTPQNATTTGGVVFPKDKNWLEGWKTSGSSAQWTLPFPLKAGGYEVVVEIACAPSSGGKIILKEEFHTLTRAILPTKNWDDFATQKLGTLRIKANATRLTITAVTVEGDGLFLLRNVKLMPLSESSPP